MKQPSIVTDSSACPCGSGNSYGACCARWHRGGLAPTAEALMRSRYSAFVLKDESYLLDSWHPRTRPPRVEFETAQKWLGLKIIDATDTGDTTAEVEFIARFRIGGASAARLHERSRFERDSTNRWLYVDGTLIDK